MSFFLGEVPLNYHVSIFLWAKGSNKTKDLFISLTVVSLGFDTISAKPATMQYISVLSALKCFWIMKMFYVKSLTLKNLSQIFSWRSFQGKKLLEWDWTNETENKSVSWRFQCKESIRGKISKYKVSPFYFVLGNPPTK